MRVRVEKEDVALIRPFAYFLDTLSELRYGKVVITDSEGNTGEGEIACAVDVNGETLQSARALAPVMESVLCNIFVEDVDDIRGAMKLVNLHIGFNTAFKCGLEQSLFNLLARRTGTCLGELMGATWRPERIACGVSYLDNLASYEERIKSLLAKSPSHIKFKVGKDPELECAAIQLLHRMSPDTRVSVDANQAFSAKAASTFIDALHVPLAWAEQMVEKSDLDGWKELRRLTKTPLMADESIHTATDAALYLELGLLDYINIKLAKSGGIFEAWKIADMAKERGVSVMLGSMLHGVLGLRYNLAFGFTRDFIARDFDNYFNLRQKQEPVLIEESTLEITDAALA